MVRLLVCYCNSIVSETIFTNLTSIHYGVPHSKNQIGCLRVRIIWNSVSSDSSAVSVLLLFTTKIVYNFYVIFLFIYVIYLFTAV